MSRKNTAYAEQVTCVNTATVTIEVHPDDSRELVSFLRAFDLQFDFSGERLTFVAGTPVDQAHTALAEYDKLSRQWRF